MRRPLSSGLPRPPLVVGLSQSRRAFQSGVRMRPMKMKTTVPETTTCSSQCQNVSPDQSHPELLTDAFFLPCDQDLNGWATNLPTAITRFQKRPRRVIGAG